MSFTDYAGLKDEIAKWSIRVGDADFEAAIPGFIMLAEGIFNNGSSELPQIRVREMEASAAISVASGSGNLPADYLEYREVRNAQGDVLEPTVTTSADYRFSQNPQGRSAEFAIKGLTIRLYPASTETADLDYYQKIPALSDADDTNWLLAKHPATYLFGAMIFAATYMEDDQGITRYGSLYTQSVGGMVKSDLRSKYIRAVSRSRTRGVTP